MLPGGYVSHSTHASSHEMNSSTHQDDDEINSINIVEDLSMLTGIASINRPRTRKPKYLSMNLLKVHSN